MRVQVDVPVFNDGATAVDAPAPTAEGTTTLSPGVHELHLTT